jgi:hypothetical protein
VNIVKAVSPIRGGQANSIAFHVSIRITNARQLKFAHGQIFLLIEPRFNTTIRKLPETKSGRSITWDCKASNQSGKRLHRRR